LYESRFADRYDTNADRWERLACRSAYGIFRQRLATIPKHPINVLDIGCGTGRNLERLAAAGIEIDRYVGIDNSERMLREAMRRHPYSQAHFVVGDAMEALHSARSVGPPDLILLTWVLSHQVDPAALLDAAANALAPGGRIIVLALTRTDRLLGRANAWRFRRFLHATPIDRSVLHLASPSLCATSSFGLVTVADIPSRTVDRSTLTDGGAMVEVLGNELDQTATASRAPAISPLLFRGASAGNVVRCRPRRFFPHVWRR